MPRRCHARAKGLKGTWSELHSRTLILHTTPSLAEAFGDLAPNRLGEWVQAGNPPPYRRSAEAALKLLLQQLESFMKLILHMICNVFAAACSMGSNH